MPVEIVKGAGKPVSQTSAAKTAAKPSPKPKDGMLRSGIGKDGAKHLDVVLKAAYEHPALGEWEAQFVEDLMAKLDRYGADLFVSDKQQEIVDRIADKVL